MPINPNDAPEGFQAVQGKGLSCEGCHFLDDPERPCPERGSGTLWCLHRARKDGCMAIFKRKDQ